MAKSRVLDTNILIYHWRHCCVRPLREYGPGDARSWASSLIELEGSSAILTPIALEFLCGVQGSHELALARAYLSGFEVVDQGDIRPDDWVQARRFAERVPHDSKPRDMADCLIAAVRQRLRYDIRTVDLGVPR